MAKNSRSSPEYRRYNKKNMSYKSKLFAKGK